MNNPPLILIIDNAPLMRHATQRVLNQAGYRTCQAGDALSGLQMARAQKPELTLLNEHLPDLSGPEVCRSIKTDPALLGCFVAILSGEHTDIPIPIDGLESSADGYFTYPFRDAELLNHVRALLRIQRTEQAIRESEQRLREVLDNAMDASYKINFQTLAFDYLSPVFERLSGRSPDEIKSLPIKAYLALVHPEDQAEVERVLSLTLSTAQSSPCQLEYRFCHKDGQYRWFHDQFTVMRDPTGMALALIGSISDISQRKQAEMDARLREGNFRNLAESILDGILIGTADGRHIFANRHASEILGYSPEEIIQTSQRDLADPAAYPLLQQRLQDRIAGRPVPPLYETIIRRKDGSSFPAEVTGTPTQWQGQACDMVIIRDITGRKQSEEALKENKEKLERLFDLLPVGISVLDRERKIVKTNPALEKILRISLEGLRLGTYKNRKYFRADGTPMPVEEFASSRVAQSLGGKARWEHVETGIEIEDGTLIWTDVSAVASPFPEWGTIIVTTDITERRHAEYRIARLSAIVESSREIIISKTLDGIITSWNTGAEEIYGYTEAEMIGKSISILVPPDRTDEMPQILDQIKSGLPVNRFETVRRRKDGQFIEVSLSISPIRNEKGEILAASTIGSDITERKQADERIRQLNAELEQQASTDYLTHLANGRYFMRRGAEEFKRAQRYTLPLALLMLDIDEFKKVNDTYGHEAGDAALQQVGLVLKSNVREIDILGRLGGDEFAVLLPNTSRSDATVLGERIRQSIANMNIQTPGNGLLKPITISLGVAADTPGMSGIDELLRNGDAAMYRAKNSGGNRVEVYPETALPPK